MANIEKEIKEKIIIAERDPPQKDSGSDSDPEADEMDMKEKLKSFMPLKVAK